MKKALSVGVLSLLLVTSAFSQKILIKEGDQYAGLKLALGAVGGASIGYVGSYERGLQDNIGIGVTLAYSGYTESYGGFYGGEWTYSNIFILANGNYHIDLLKDEKLDTWGALSVGYNVASVKFKWNTTVPAGTFEPSASAGGFVIGLSANARYFLTEKLAVAASVGFGLGILNIGLDYKL